MKKLLLAMCPVALIFTSCDLNINDDPEYPQNSTITTDLLFPSVQNYVAVSAFDIMFNYAGFCAQYFEQMPEANQFNDIAEQNITESSQIIDRAYRNLYAGALMDIEDIKSKTTNKADLFAAQVMRTYIFQLLVDNMDDCPYSEALQGGANSSPKWDDGETVYRGVLAELDEAEDALDASSDIITMTDMICGKNLAQWKGYANALRLRMYLRMYDKDNSLKEKIQALVSENNFFSGDLAMDVFSSNEGNRTPFYATNYGLNTANHCASHPIVSYLSFTADPRINYAFNKNAEGKYVGQIPGAKTEMKNWTSSGDWKNKDVSTVNYKLYDNSGESRPVYFFTQSNLQFLIAEVELRFNNDAAKAKAAYEAAVKADFALRGYDNADTFLAGSEVSFDAATDKLSLIYMQKWVALFYIDNMEAWSEIRRTDVPKLSPLDGKAVYTGTSYEAGNLIEPYRNGMASTGKLIKRMFYPQSAINLNKNTPKSKPATTPVWWDVN